MKPRIWIKRILRSMRAAGRWLKDAVTNGNAWAGFFPTVILALLAWLAISQTRDQLSLVREQLSYSRRPVLRLRDAPGASALYPRLYLGNVGNDTAETVNIKFAVLLVSGDSVFTLVDSRNIEARFTDSIRTPRERLWPRAKLGPDQEIDVSRKFAVEFRRKFLFSPGNHPVKPDSLTLPSEKEILLDLYEIRQLLKGGFYIWAEWSYRSAKDYSPHSDTGVFCFTPGGPWPWSGDVRNMVGGPKVENSISRYLRNGPERSINVGPDSISVLLRLSPDFWSGSKLELSAPRRPGK